MKLKVYTYDDNLFCWGMVVVAESAEQAASMWNTRNDSNVLATDLQEHELEGFMFEAGGNG